MSQSIGGQLDMSALSALSGIKTDAERTRHFRLLTHDQQVQAIKRMALSGHGDSTIANATGWSIELVRVALGERSA